MAAHASSRPVVLVVEDEPLLRWNTVAVIGDAGFEVLEATNAIRRLPSSNSVWTFELSLVIVAWPPKRRPIFGVYQPQHQQT